MAHVMMAAAIAYMMVMMPVKHRTVRGSHPPAAKAAEGIDPGTAIVTEKRASEQPSDKRQYKNEYNKSEHFKSPFAGDPALISP